MNNEKEGSKRKYVRVDGYFPILWKKIPEDRLKEEKKRFFRQRDLIPREPWEAFEWLSQGEWEAEGTSELESRLDRVLAGIQIKLDLILNLLMKKEVDPIYHTSPIEVNISGAGVRFRASESFDIGSHYELRMLLPILPVRVVHTLGKVIRVNESREDEKKTNEVSFAFEVISEEDREIIIHYTFKRQRELLREKRKKKTEI